MRSRSRSSSSSAGSDPRTLRLTVAYDGTRYAGWQRQRNGRGSTATIQETLEQALRTILREPVRVIASGRTDAGVHAAAQVAHVRTRSPMPRPRLLRGVNHLLPADVAVLHIDEASPRFHARFDAAGKRYRYRLFTGPVVPPFIRPYVHHVRARLSVARMRREASALKGRHDFRAFARAGSLRGRRSRRAVSAVTLRRRAEELVLDIEGNGFLHTMVRSIAGTLIDVGRGRLPPGTIRRMLATGDRRLAGTTAPAKGLTLIEVRYGRRG
jgi:tRNA pseudouridine38-40 synthase